MATRRQADRAALLHWLESDASILTITGPPGIGKSHLAASIDDLARPPSGWATADPAGQDPWLEQCSGKAILVDDADQDLEALRALITRQRDGSGRRWLITSRTPLFLPDEQVLRLAGLEAEDWDWPPGVEPSARMDLMRKSQGNPLAVQTLLAAAASGGLGEVPALRGLMPLARANGVVPARHATRERLLAPSLARLDDDARAALHTLSALGMPVHEALAAEWASMAPGSMQTLQHASLLVPDEVAGWWRVCAWAAADAALPTKEQDEDWISLVEETGQDLLPDHYRVACQGCLRLGQPDRAIRIAIRWLLAELATCSEEDARWLGELAEAHLTVDGATLTTLLELADYDRSTRLFPADHVERTRRIHAESDDPLLDAVVYLYDTRDTLGTPDLEGALALVRARPVPGFPPPARDLARWIAGRVLSRAGRPDDALAAFVGLKTPAVQSLKIHLAVRRCRMREARDWSLQAIASGRFHGRILAQAWAHLVQIHHVLGDLDAAEEAHRVSQGMYRAHGQVMDASFAELRAAGLYRARGHHRAAMETTAQVRAGALEKDLPVLVAFANGFEGDVALALDQLDRAHDLYQAAADVLAEHGLASQASHYRLCQQGTLERPDRDVVEAERAAFHARGERLFAMHGDAIAGLAALGAGEVRQAMAIYDQVRRESEQHGLGPDAAPLRWASRLRDALVARAPVVVASDGSWLDAGDRVELGHRPALCGLLATLASATEPLESAALIAGGWPDERMSPSSAKNRLHVSLNMLRKMGLQDALCRAGQGWRLAPEVFVYPQESA